jgi:amino acid transporter
VKGNTRCVSMSNPSLRNHERHLAGATELRAGALKFPAVLMQGITHIAPAVGLVFSIQFVTLNAGVTAPLAYAIAVLIMLTLGVSLSQLARHIPSAGGYYTYIARTIHPRAGLLTAWLYLLYDPAATAINIAFMGLFFERTMRAEYGLWCPWWLFFLASTAVLTFFVYRGIALSTELMIVLGAAEILIVIALSAFGFAHPGRGGINFDSYTPSRAPTPSGLALGVIFSIFSVNGFDAVIPLAEESENPRWTQPRAIMAAILFTGAFYLFCSWAVLIGWGTHDVGGFSNSTENPCFVLARKYWGKAWILIFVAVLNSIFAVSIASTNAATRVFFAMGRSAVLPRALGRVHPRHLTPTNAIWLQTFLTLAVGLGLGFWIGPDQEFFFMGVVMTLGLVLIYAVSNFGVYRFFRHEMRAEFRAWPHILCPVFSTAALVAVGIASVNPLPAAPLRYAPVVVIAWLFAGLLFVWLMSRTGHETWLSTAGLIPEERAAGSFRD